MSTTNKQTNSFLEQYPVPYLKIFKLIYNAIYHRQPMPVSEVTIFGSRFGGKTHSYMWLALRCLLMGLPVTIYILRYYKYDVIPTVWNEFNNKLESSGVDLKHVARNITQKWIKFGQCAVYFKGLHVTKRDKIVLKGLFEFTTPYCLAIFEECDEIEPEEISDIKTAMRGDHPDARLLTIACGNPYSFENPFSKYFDRYLPYDEDRMRRNGWYSAVVKDPVVITKLDGTFLTIPDTKLFIRNSIEANPYALSNPDTVRKVNDWKITNKFKYKAWYWGKPVQIHGDVFSHLTKYIQYGTPEELKDNPHATFRVGLDFGYEHNAYAAICVARLKKGEVVVAGELYILPEKVNTSHEVMIQRTYLWLKSLTDLYPQMVRNKVVVFCDQSDWIYKRILEGGSSNWSWLTWAGSGDYKRLPLSLRIGYIQMLLSRQKLYLVENEGAKFLEELNGAQYRQKTQQLLLEKKDDHLLDAFIYSNSEWYQPIKE